MANFEIEQLRKLNPAWNPYSDEQIAQATGLPLENANAMSQGWESAGLAERSNDLLWQATQAQRAGDATTAAKLAGEAEALSLNARRIAPRVQEASEIRGLRDGFNWLGGAVGSGARSSMKPMAAGLAGAAAGALSPIPGGALIGGTLGAFGAGYDVASEATLANYLNDPELRDKSLDEKVNRARMAAVPEAALDTVGTAISGVGSKVLRKGVTSIADDVAKKGFGRYVAGRAAESILGEGATGGAQNISGQLIRNDFAGTPNKDIDWKAAANDAAAEAAGGVVGAGTGAVQGVVGKFMPTTRGDTKLPPAAAQGASAGEAFAALERKLSAPTPSQADEWMLNTPLDGKLPDDQLLSHADNRAQAAQRIAQTHVDRADNTPEMHASAKFLSALNSASEGERDTLVEQYKSDLSRAGSTREFTDAVQEFKSLTSSKNSEQGIPDHKDASNGPLSQVREVWMKHNAKLSDVFGDLNVDDAEVRNGAGALFDWVLDGMPNFDKVAPAVSRMWGKNATTMVKSAHDYAVAEGLRPAQDVGQQLSLLTTIANNGSSRLTKLGQLLRPTLQDALTTRDVRMLDKELTAYARGKDVGADFKGKLGRYFGGHTDDVIALYEPAAQETLELGTATVDEGRDENGDTVESSDWTGNIQEEQGQTIYHGMGNGPFDTIYDRAKQALQEKKGSLPGAFEVGVWTKLKRDYIDNPEVLREQENELIRKYGDHLSVKLYASREAKLAAINRRVRLLGENVRQEKEAIDIDESELKSLAMDGGTYGQLVFEREVEDKSKQSVNEDGEITFGTKLGKWQTSAAKLIERMRKARKEGGFEDEKEGTLNAAQQLRQINAGIASIMQLSDFTGRIGIRDASGETQWLEKGKALPDSFQVWGDGTTVGKLKEFAAQERRSGDRAGDIDYAETHSEKVAAIKTYIDKLKDYAKTLAEGGERPRANKLLRFVDVVVDRVADISEASINKLYGELRNQYEIGSDKPKETSGTYSKEYSDDIPTNPAVGIEGSVVDDGTRGYVDDKGRVRAGSQARGARRENEPVKGLFQRPLEVPNETNEMGGVVDPARANDKKAGYDTTVEIDMDEAANRDVANSLDRDEVGQDIPARDIQPVLGDKQQAYITKLLDKGVPAFVNTVKAMTEQQRFAIRAALREMVKTGKLEGSMLTKAKNVLKALRGVAEKVGAGDTALSRNKRLVGAALSETQVNDIIKRLAVGWKDRNASDLVEVIDSAADIPGPVQQAAREQGAPFDEIAGFVFQGKAYLVRDKHSTEAEVAETFFHEVYGHLGQRALFGEASKEVLSSLWTQMGGQVGLLKLAEKYGVRDDLQAYVDGLRAANMPAVNKHALLVNELIAHAAQVVHNGEHGQLIQKWLGQVRQVLATLLEKAGASKLVDVLGLNKFTNADLALLLHKSKKAITQGGKVAPGEIVLMTLSTEIHNALGKEGFAATHDSPIRHEGKFNWREHKGSGEGNAAFGAGTYLSTADGVHRSYKEGFTASVEKPELTAAQRAYVDKQAVADGALAQIKNAEQYPDKPFYQQRAASFQRGYDAAIAWLKEHAADAPKKLFGAGVSPTYSVTVNVKPEELLDWDAPLSEQSELVKGALESAGLKDKGVRLEWEKDDGELWAVHSGLEIVGGSPDATWFGINSKDGVYKLSIDYEYYGEYLTLKEAKAAAEASLGSYASGANLYTRLAERLGSQTKASDYLQSLGIVGHKYAASGGKQDKFPNYVIYDDSRIETNYVHFSNQSQNQTPLTAEEKQAILDELATEHGPTLKVQFEDLIGASGKHHAGLIRLAHNAAFGVHRHESLHEFFRILKEAGSAETVKLLENVATNKLINGQLRRLLQDSPKALKQLGDPEEAAAYLYQFWKAGLITLGPKSDTFFQKVANLIKSVLKLTSESVRDMGHAETILRALSEGKFASEPSVAAQAVEKALARQRADYANVFWRKLGNADFMRKAVFTAGDVLRDTKNPALIKLADKLYTPATGKMGEQSYFDALPQQRAVWLNKLDKLMIDQDPEDIKLALKHLQGESDLKNIHDPVIRKLVGDVRKHLDDMYEQYIVPSGMQHWDEENKAWKPVPKIKAKYFPRVWDTTALVDDKDGFVQKLMELHEDDLKKIGGKLATPEQVALEIHRRLVEGNGVPDITEDRSSLGITPFAQAVNKRSLNWIDAAAFEPYMSKDVASILTNYTVQMIKRGEYQKRFGPDGAKIQESLDEALLHDAFGKDQQKAQQARDTLREQLKEHRSKKTDDAAPTMTSVLIKTIGEKQTLALREKLNLPIQAIMAAEGTLGREISDNMREVFGYVTIYQNMRTLSLALFSSLVDPMGIVVRGGTMNDAYEGFVRGIKEVVKGWKGELSNDEMSKLAERLGTVDASSFMDALGQTYSSIYMSGKLKTWNDKLFKWNGMEAWNRAMRIQATGAAIGFIERHLTKPTEHSERYLKDELGLTGDGYLKDGSLDVDNPQVQQAIVRWVNGAILRPNAMQRPIIASDPHYELVYHLKQFTYSFHKTILARVANEAQHGNMSPAMALMVGYVPVMIAADVIKELLRPGEEPPWMKQGLGAYVEHGVMRSNLLGIPQIGLEALPTWGNAERTGSDAARLFGPAAEQTMEWLEVPLSEKKTFGQEFVQSLPFQPLYSKALAG